MRRKLIATILMAFVALFAYVGIEHTWGARLAVQWTSIRVAGFSSINCGFVGIDKNTDRANICALTAHKDGHPFRVVYQYLGRDFIGTSAFLQDKQGHLFTITDDSMGATHATPVTPYFIEKMPTSPCDQIELDSFQEQPSTLICRRTTANSAPAK